jgi:hypothetical protein
VTVCRHNLGGRPEAGAVAVAARQTRRGVVPRSNRQSRAAGAADGRWVAASRRVPVRGNARDRDDSPVGRLPAAHRSGRVSGIRPSDRRGPGPAGHRGRNVRSTGRCSYNLRITRRRADSCGLHRSTSQVIRRSGSGVFFFFVVDEISAPRVRGAQGLSTVTIFRSTLGRGSRRAGGRRASRERTRPRGRIRRARDRRGTPVPRARL